jgi:hypothetical protein
MAADIFASLSDEELQALLEDRDSSNTDNIIGPSKRILLEYCCLDHIDVDELVAKSKEESWCFFFINFYVEIRETFFAC